MIDHSSDRRFSTGVPVSARRKSGGNLAHRLRLAGGGVLDVLRLVQDHAPPVHRLQRFHVLPHQGVAGQHQIHSLRCLGESLASSGGRRPGGPAWSGPGAKRRTSRSQLVTTEVGQTSSTGGRAALPRLSLSHAAAAQWSGWSCPGPCRRPGRRPGPTGAGNAARSSRSSW